MALLDYLRGPKHKAEADLLRLELVALQTRYTTLEEVARELSVLDLIAIKTKIQGEETRCVTLQASIALEEENLQRRQFQLRVLDESPRLLRRLQTLRRWSHEQEIKSFFTRGPRTRCSLGARA